MVLDPNTNNAFRRVSATEMSRKNKNVTCFLETTFFRDKNCSNRQDLKLHNMLNNRRFAIFVTVANRMQSQQSRSWFERSGLSCHRVGFENGEKTGSVAKNSETL